jgi:hypothetical protein
VCRGNSFRNLFPQACGNAESKWSHRLLSSRHPGRKAHREPGRDAQTLSSDKKEQENGTNAAVPQPPPTPDASGSPARRPGDSGRGPTKNAKLPSGGLLPPKIFVCFAVETGLLGNCAVAVSAVRSVLEEHPTFRPLSNQHSARQSPIRYTAGHCDEEFLLLILDGHTKGPNPIHLGRIDGRPPAHLALAGGRRVSHSQSGHALIQTENVCVPQPSGSPSHQAPVHFDVLGVLDPQARTEVLLAPPGEAVLSGVSSPRPSRDDSSGDVVSSFPADCGGHVQTSCSLAASRQTRPIDTPNHTIRTVSVLATS